MDFGFGFVVSRLWGGFSDVDGLVGRCLRGGWLFCEFGCAYYGFDEIVGLLWDVISGLLCGRFWLGLVFWVWVSVLGLGGIVVVWFRFGCCDCYNVVLILDDFVLCCRFMVVIWIWLLCLDVVGWYDISFCVFWGFDYLALGLRFGISPWWVGAFGFWVCVLCLMFGLIVAILLLRFGLRVFEVVISGWRFVGMVMI